MRDRPLDQIDVIIVHCTDSSYGDVETIDGWHEERFGEPCGYHYVICNCYPTQDDHADRRPLLDFDGMIQHGRPLTTMGTHCAGHNWRSIGIALVGKTVFSSAQLRSLRDLVARIRKELGQQVPIAVHNQFNSAKTCPNIGWPALHALIDN